jgi:hypothetical protein
MFILSLIGSSKSNLFCSLRHFKSKNNSNNQVITKLKKLREFRDSYVQNLPDGEDLIWIFKHAEGRLYSENTMV